MARKKRNKNSGPLSTRRNTRLTPAQQEAIVREYFLCGSKNETARRIGVSTKAVTNALAIAQNDPALMAKRGEAYDQMAGEIADVTREVVRSIKPEDLTTTRHEVRDTSGNLMRVVTEGPSLRDKALCIGILTDKQHVLAKARNEAAQQVLGAAGGNAALMLPELIADKEALILKKAKRLRIIDVEFDTGETGQTLNMALNRVGIDDKDVAEAEVVEVGPNPFD